MALVPALPSAPVPPTPIPDDVGGDSVVLCREDNPPVLSALLAALDEAGIEAYNLPLHDPGAGLSRPFPAPFNPALAYEIRVRESDLPAAQAILNDLLEKEGESANSESEGETPGEIPAPSTEPWAEAAIAEVTVEAWSGDDERLSGFLTAALTENNIVHRVERAGPVGGLRVLVSSRDAPRAREIVREVVEGVPPD